MDKGFLSTSTRMIAEVAGITQPNLYHYFKTKEEIYVAVLEDLAMTVRVELDKIVAADGAPLDEKLKEIFFYLKDKHPVNLYIMQHDIHHELSKDSFQELYAIWRNAYLTPLTRLFDQYTTDRTTFSSEELARHFYATIAPYIQKDTRRINPLSFEQIIHLFVYGILDKKN